MQTRTIEQRHADHVASGGTLTLAQFVARESRRQQEAARQERMRTAFTPRECPECHKDMMDDEDECGSCGHVSRPSARSEAQL